MTRQARVRTDRCSAGIMRCGMLFGLVLLCNTNHFYQNQCVALGSNSPRPFSSSTMSTLAAAPAPQSPVAKARGLSPPPAPGRGSNKKRGNSHGQVLVDVVEVVLVSGNLLAEIARLADQFWYTSQLRCQVATLLDVEPHRVKLVDGDANEISDDECVLQSPLTAIVAPASEPLAFEGAMALRM